MKNLRIDMENYQFTATVTGAYSLYLHTLPDDMKYVGITSVAPKERWKKRYNQRFLQAVADWGGWDNVKQEVLYEDMPKWLAGKMERIMIAKYNTLWPFGYNCEDGGFEDVHSFGEKTYPVKQIDPDTGETVRMWHSARLAEESGKGKEGQKLDCRRIRDSCNGVKYRKTHGGWAWEKAAWEEYKDYYLTIEKPKIPVEIHFEPVKKSVDSAVERQGEYKQGVSV